MLLVYGSTGYTGGLVVEEALARGLRPVLAGRSADKVAAQGAATGLATRVFPVEAPDLAGVSVVLNCAGPFTRTARPLVDACLRARAHYVDVTGEIAVFEALARRDADARAAGVGLLPGAGFDVVPSDCLAAHLASRLPGASHLTLAFQSFGGASHGTMTTALTGLGEPSAVRRGGRIVPAPHGRTVDVDFGDGPVPSVGIPWGDVSTAFHTTGIPDIEVYAAFPPGTTRMMKAGAYLGPILRLPWVRRALQARVDALPPGPTPEQRARGHVRLWGEATHPDGRRVRARMRTPEGYTLTARTSVEIARRALAGELPPGFQTPAGAFGADFVLGFEGVEREDV